MLLKKKYWDFILVLVIFCDYYYFIINDFTYYCYYISISTCRCSNRLVEVLVVIVEEA